MCGPSLIMLNAALFDLTGASKQCDSAVASECAHSRPERNRRRSSAVSSQAELCGRSLGPPGGVALTVCREEIETFALVSCLSLCQ